MPNAKRDSTNIDRLTKKRQKSKRFAKLKEVFCLLTSRHKNTTFNFTQPHPKPTHHSTSGQVKRKRYFISHLVFGQLLPTIQLLQTT